MKRSPPFFIGFRYLLSRKGNRVVSFTSLMSMAGITLGVFVLILVLSVYNGSQGVQRERTLITVPHADLSASGFRDWQAAMPIISGHPDVEAVAPWLGLEGMLSQRGFHQVTQVKGIDPMLEDTVSPLSEHMLLGSLQDLAPGRFNIILGRNLAASLRVNVGDDVNLVLAEVNASSQGFSLDSRTFHISGIFDVRFTIGSDIAYINLQDAAQVMGLQSPEAAQHLRLQVSDIHRANAVLGEIMDSLEAEYPDQTFQGIDWSRSQASLFTALRMEKVMTGFMLMMIVTIGAFNIVSTLVMVVSDKQADIAILRTMGAAERTVMGIFLVQGSLVGIAGTLIGAVAGITLVLNFDRVSGLVDSLLSPSGMFIIASLPAELQWGDVITVCAASLLISFVATLYPAWRASGIQPAEVLRYE